MDQRNLRAKFKQNPEHKQSSCSKPCGDDIVPIRRAFADAATRIDESQGSQSPAKCGQRWNIPAFYNIIVKTQPKP